MGQGRVLFEEIREAVANVVWSEVALPAGSGDVVAVFFMRLIHCIAAAKIELAQGLGIG